MRERGLDPGLLVAGTPYNVAHLSDKDERVEWSALVRMLENGRKVWTREQLLRLGQRSTEGPLVQFIGVVARIRFSVPTFFQWVAAPDGVASQMITCVKTTCTTEGPGRLIVDFKMEPGFVASEEFFLITQGTYEAMPKMLGAPPAEISAAVSSDGARFAIQYTEPRGIISTVRRAVTWPFTMRQAADELAGAHSSLLARYRQLDTMRVALERQHELVDVAYQVGQQVWGQRTLEAIGDVVMTSLLARKSVCGVRFVVGDVEFDRGTLAGVCTSVELQGSRDRGRIDVWTTTIDDEVRNLVDLLAPTVALAIDNMLAYRALADYQEGLERLVVERTRELSTARDELAGTVEQLKDAQGARERFFGNVSHEIRTPLSLIMLAAGDIEARAGKLLDPRSSQSLGSVTEAARKLVRLVDELLLLAAGQENKLQLHREPTDLGALVSQLMAAWRPAADAAGLELEARALPSLIASVDPVAIERVASNLVSNAVKYTPRGGRVEIELFEDASRIRLSVLDNGPGIAEELAGRLFGRFERGASDRGKNVGTGIGLSLVKQLVEAHDGTIEAVRRTPTGTEMRVILPRTDMRDEVAPMRGLRLEVAATSRRIESGSRFDPAVTSAGTIVVAEDDAGLAEMTARLLSEKYTVFVGLDGEAAFELVRKHHPQVLITDIDMPLMNGIELAKRFREHTGDRLAPIIMLSAVLDLGTRVAGLEAGAIDYVTKPFDPRELIARVDAQFRMRELAVRLHRAEQLSTLGILTSGLAHEIRNPANGIVNAVAPLKELLPKELIGPTTGPGQLIDVIAQCAEQIAFLSRQLLGFKPGGRLDLRAVKLSDIIERSLVLAQVALSNVQVRRELADCEVLCSGPLLVQAVTNLVENAGHAAGHQGWVQVTTRSEGGRTSVEVSDSGPGVPIALRDRIFEPFFTTKSPGVGTGLGLSVSRAIVQRHGGVLEIRERLGRATFVIELPNNSLRGEGGETV